MPHSPHSSARRAGEAFQNLQTSEKRQGVPNAGDFPILSPSDPFQPPPKDLLCGDTLVGLMDPVSGEEPSGLQAVASYEGSAFQPGVDPQTQANPATFPMPGVPGEVVARWHRLATEIDRHDRLYYDYDRPEISDADYDILRRQLTQLHKRYPALDRLGGPLFRVGSPGENPTLAALPSAKRQDAAGGSGSTDPEAQEAERPNKKAAARGGESLKAQVKPVARAQAGTKPLGRQMDRSPQDHPRLLDQPLDQGQQPLSLDRPLDQGQSQGQQPLLAKVRHLAPVMSLDNVFSRSDLAQFVHKVNRFLGLPSQHPLAWVAEPKIDGLTVVLRYQQGRLIHGATRGDGQVGELITANVRTLADVPTVLAASGWPQDFEVRGEAFLEKEAFEVLNRKRQAQGLPLFANARNAAAGSLRHLNPQQSALRPLRFVAHDASFLSPALGAGPGGGQGLGLHTYPQAMEALASWGMPVTSYGRLCPDEEACLAAFYHLEATRDQLPYEVDGVVFKLADLALYQRLGMSARAPRYAFAYKFPAIQASSVIKAIDIQVGRTGVLTPVAHIDPVSIGGVVVARASLHNAQEIARKDLRVGDRVIVQRAGDVIPQVVAAVVDQRPAWAVPFEFPTQCPLCQSPVVQREGEAALRCSGRDRCIGQDVWRLRHFVSRDACDIEGLGKRHIQALYDQGLIRDFASLMTLRAQDLEGLPGWGIRSAANVIAQIQARRQQPLDRWIYSLGIPTVGQATARLLARHYHTVDAFMEACQRLDQADRDAIDDLLGIEGVGPETLKALSAAWGQHHKTWQQVLPHMTILDHVPQESLQSGGLAGKKVVFTGTLTHMTRAEAKQQAQQLGVQVQTSLSRLTDWLIAGSDSGSKLDKARELGVEVLSQDEWQRRIQEAQRGPSLSGDDLNASSNPNSIANSKAPSGFSSPISSGLGPNGLGSSLSVSQGVEFTDQTSSGVALPGSVPISQPLAEPGSAGENSA